MKKFKVLNNPYYFSKRIFLFIIVFNLVFSSGLIYEITGTSSYGDIPKSPMLSDGRIDTSYVDLSELSSALWLDGTISSNYSINADYYSKLILFVFLYDEVKIEQLDSSNYNNNSIVYDRTWNIKENSYYNVYYDDANIIYSHVNRTDFYSILESRNIIYNNEHSLIRY